MVNSNSTNIRTSLLTEHLKFQGIPLDSRPNIPKVPYSKTTLQTVLSIDNLLQEYVTTESDLDEIRHWIYVAARTTAKLLGITKEDKEKNVSVFKNYDPPWRRRLEHKIGDLRRKIGVLNNYLNSPHLASIKLKTKIDELIVKHIGSVSRSELNAKLSALLELLKQKLAVYANRIRRYTKTESRRKENRLFQIAERKMYNLLKSDKKEKSLPLLHPDKLDFYNYWGNIWCNPKKFNRNAFWLKNLQEETQDISIMDGMVINVEDVQASIKCVHNWKAPGPDKIQNYWLKHFKSTHGALASFYQKLLDNSIIPPKDFCLGTTYLILKKKKRSSRTGRLSPNYMS